MFLVIASVASLHPRGSIVLAFTIGSLVGFFICGHIYRYQNAMLRRELNQLKVTSIHREVIYDRLATNVAVYTSMSHAASTRDGSEEFTPDTPSGRAPFPAASSAPGSDDLATQEAPTAGQRYDAELEAIQHQMEQTQAELQSARGQLDHLHRQLSGGGTSQATIPFARATQETIPFEPPVAPPAFDEELAEQVI